MTTRRSMIIIRRVKRKHRRMTIRSITGGRRGSERRRNTHHHEKQKKKGTQHFAETPKIVSSGRVIVSVEGSFFTYVWARFGKPGTDPYQLGNVSLWAWGGKGVCPLPRLLLCVIFPCL